MFQEHAKVVAIKSITKKNLAKSQSLLGKEIKILKVSSTLHILNRFSYRSLEKIWKNWVGTIVFNCLGAICYNTITGLNYQDDFKI